MTLSLPKQFLAKIEKHEILLLSGSFAYTTALALAPFLIIMLSVLSFLGPQSQAAVIEQMTHLLGSQAGEALKIIADNAQREARFSGLSGILSFLIILISASAMFSQMRTALDKVNEYQPTQGHSGFRGFAREKILSVGLVLGFIFLLIVSLFVTTGLSALLQGEETVLWSVLSFVINFAAFAVLFSAMFRFIPSKKFPLRRCAISGVWATAFFLVGKGLIGLYLGRSAIGSAYGAAGSLVVLLVWLYYSSLTLLLSYEFTNTIVFRVDS
jgi:membrane protein